MKRSRYQKDIEIPLCYKRTRSARIVAWWHNVELFAIRLVHPFWFLVSAGSFSWVIITSN